MRWVVHLVLMAAVLAVPLAEACSLRGPHPPAPGRFDVRAMDGGLLGSVEVHERLLGGDCALGNPYFLAAGEFGWMEGGQLRVLDRTSGAVQALDIPERVGRISADAAGWSIAGQDATWWAPRPLVVAVQVDLPDGFRVWHLDGAYAVLARSNPHGLRLFDLVNQSWAGPLVERPYLLGGNRDWMAFEGLPGTVVAIEARTGRETSWSIAGAPIALDSAVLWSRHNDTFVGLDVANGETQSHPSAFPYYYGPVFDGLVVERHYSAAHAVEPQPPGTLPGSAEGPPSQGEPRGTPAAGLAGVALAVTLALRRR